MPKQKLLFRDHSLPDVSVQQSLQDWLPIEIDQISQGGFQGRLREVHHASGSVFFEHQNRTVHKRGIIEDDFCTVSFAREMKRSSDLRFSEYHAPDDTMFFLPRACEFDVQVAADVQVVYFRFSQSMFLERARAVDPAQWENDPDDLLAFDAPARRGLEAFATQLNSSSLFHADSDVYHIGNQFGSYIMDEVLMALNNASTGGYDSGVITRRRAMRVMKEVLEYLEAEFNHNRCPSIVDICQQIGVSQRSLQYSFHEILGLAPKTYLRYLRLNRVYAELTKVQNAETTVTDIAISWNFYHLGRFSNDYLQLFGELPSTTLRKAMVREGLILRKSDSGPFPGRVIYPG